MEFSRQPNLRVIMMGGEIVPELLIATGPELVSQSQRFKPDLSIVSAHGVTIDEGATVESWEDACIKSMFIRNSAETVVLAGQEKIGFSASYSIAEIKDFAYLISDAAASQLTPFVDAGLTVWTV
jgi:DeoR/GlpR family transcriptional regulator of sugar metabolism